MLAQAGQMRDGQDAVVGQKIGLLDQNPKRFIEANAGLAVAAAMPRLWTHLVHGIEECLPGKD